jgi:hypothetical protein
VVNDADATDLLKSAAQKVATVVPAPHVLSGEDFFSRTGASSCFCFVGSALPGAIRPHHRCEYNP